MQKISPDYVAQVGGVEYPKLWLANHDVIARRRGLTFVRASVLGNFLLFEAWRERPETPPKPRFRRPKLTAERRRQIIAIMSQRTCRCPRYPVEYVAALFGVSRQTVQRVYTDAGITLKRGKRLIGGACEIRTRETADRLAA